MSTINKAIETAKDLFLSSRDCTTSIHRVQVPAHYDRVASILSDAADELGVVATVVPVKMVTPGGVIDGTEIQLINNPLSTVSAVAVQYSLQRMALYLGCMLPEVSAFMIISPETTTCYTRLDINGGEDD